jgi:hypothetical protein
VAAKSQIEIDVNSAEFQEFKAKFDKYCTALETIPDSWKKIGQASSVARTNFESMAAGMAVVGSSFAAIQKSGTEFYRVTTATARHWKELAVSTGGVAKNIISATESLLKWTGILSLVTGGGGLFGFDRLAHSVASQRAAALGTGTSYGSAAAFDAAFRRFGDPEGFRARVAEDIANQGVKLRNAGLTEAEMKGDTADVATRLYKRLTALAKVIPESQYGTDPHFQIINNDPAVLRRLAAHPGEVEEAAGAFQENRNRLNLTPISQLS